MSKTQSIEQQFASEIIDMLKNGTAPWVKPWKSGKIFHRDFNPITNTVYSGINTLMLYNSRLRHNFEDVRWLTYKNAQKAGWQVKKGEHGTPIIFSTNREVDDAFRENHPNIHYNKRKDANGDIHYSYFMFTFHTVFNAEQIDGMPSLKNTSENVIPSWEVCLTGEKILTASSAKIVYGGDRAYYTPNNDVIHLPVKDIFFSESGFYGTALHELSHWTGHYSRLNRDILNLQGSENYAREELRAEIASWLIARETGIPHDPQNHVAYIDSWIHAIQNDYREIRYACADAEKITNYLLAFASIKRHPHKTAA